MNKSFLLFYIFLSVIIITGCKKGNNENSFRGTYTTANSITVNPPKMYTKFGVVNDLFIIKNYLRRSRNPLFNSTDTNFIFDQSTEAKNLNISVRFDGSDSVIVQLSNPNVSFTQQIVRNTSDQFVLTPRDSSIIYTNTNPVTNRFYAVDYSLEKNNPGSPGFNSYYNNGFNYLVKALYRSTLLIENGELVMPLLTQHITLPNSESWSANNWKLLNNNISDILQPGDTIVVQTKTVKLIKQ